MDEELLEPLKGYKEKYKQLNYDNTIKFFDELVKKSNINIDENIKTVNLYDCKINEINNKEKELNGKKGLKTFLIILTIINFIGSLVLFILYGNNTIDSMGLGIILPIILIILGIIYIILIKKKINPIINNLNTILEKLRKEAEELLNTAWNQMAPLNKIYDWGMSEKLFSETVPLIKMDTYFDIKKYEYLHDKYDYCYNTSDDTSTYLCESGTILGNPFLVCTDFLQKWRNHRYTGTLTISYYVTVSDGRGGYRRELRTETLYAHVDKPEPYYYYNTYLVYGNDAAPNLSFSRDATDCENMNEKQLEKYIKKEIKKADKQAEKATTSGNSFTRMGNDEFEALFGAHDRDNEVEFRLLFTPLAQNNMVKLIKDKDPYGDDFYFFKSKKVNIIMSEHSQTFSYYSTPERYVSYSYNIARKKFIDYNTTFFKAVYFDLAPLMSIPLYQQHKSLDFIYDKPINTNVSYLEHESISNSFNKELFRPNKSETDIILKSHYDKSIGKSDIVDIHSYSYSKKYHTTLVPVMGGDGCMHNVPVEWIEYIKESKTRSMMVEIKNSSREEFNDIKDNNNFNNIINKFNNTKSKLYERGLFAVLLDNNINKDNIDELNNFYKDK